MQKLVKEYLNEWKKQQKRRRRTGTAAILLIVMVVGCVIGSLTQYGVALTGEPKCGKEEHQHNDSCYTSVLSCGQEESEGHQHDDSCYTITSGFTCGQEESEEHQHDDSCYTEISELICGQEESSGHIHTGDCYTEEFTCGMQEHEHTDECYIDTDADVEDAAVWDAQYEHTEWKGRWGEDLVTAARMQIGYEESQDNYEVAEDGSHNGYTRYGQFIGEPYADWDAAFINFCIHYAGMEESNLFPETADSAKWQDEFNKIDEKNSSYLTEATAYAPEPGDIIFQEQEDDEASVQMGIVSDYDETSGEVTVIEGDSEDSVKENKYNAEDTKIKSYLKINEMEADQTDDQDAQQNEMQPEQDVAAVDESNEEQTNENSEVAYVKGFKITGMIDGSAPFDEHPAGGYANDKTYVPGDDEGAYNGIVRTFDKVQYGFHIEMASTDNEKLLKDACVILKFVLPASKDEAEFDLDAMSWLEPLEDGGSLQPMEDTENKKQVLIGKVTLKSEKYVVPGSYKSNVTVKINNMQNGSTLEPIFYAAMGSENGTTDSGNVNWGEALPAGKVTVSAAPKYNVYVNGDVANIREEFDFNSGKEGAVNKGKGKIIGNVLKVGAVLQLYNDYPSKGMKGIQLPTQGSEIRFQFNIDTKYIQDATGSEISDSNLKKNYMPLLWSFDGSKDLGYGGKDQYDRTLNDTSWCRALVPDNSGEGENACYNGGTWQAEQDPTTGVVTVKVRDWKIDTEKMPNKNGYGEEDVYKANMGCFSAGEFIFIQPFNKEGSSSTAPNYDIVNEQGEGLFNTSIVTDGQLKVDGQIFSSKDKEYKSVVRSIGLKKPGNMTNRVGFLEPGERWLSPGYTAEMEPGGHFGYGDGYVLAGDVIEIAGGITFGRSEEYGRMQFGTNLMKFDGEKLEPTGGIRDTFGNEPHNKATLDTGNGDEGMILDTNTFVFYAAKPDGSNWTDNDEMQTTYEKDLIFYKNLNDLKNDRKICVGILTCFKGLGSKEYINAIYQVAHEVEVIRNDEYLGKTCEVISTSRVWAEKIKNKDEIGYSYTTYPDKWQSIDWKDISFENESGKNYFKGLPSALRTSYYNKGQNNLFYKAHYYNGNINGRNWNEEELPNANDDYFVSAGRFYTGTVYGEDGGIKVPHLSDGMDTGDTVLILGYKAGITKSLMQKVEQKKVGKENETELVEKTNYNLNKDQRIVDYKLQPSIRIDKPGTGKTAQTTDITIVDTLDKDMEYVSNSAYLGGDYEQISSEGGKKGEITGGEKIEPVRSKDEKGCQILTWTIRNVNISEARNGMDAIYYSAKIKNSICSTMGNDTSTKVINKVHISSTDDKRDRTLKNGNCAKQQIIVELEKKTSHGKIVDQKIVEENGRIDYTVYFNNFDQNASESTKLVVDRMPQDGKGDSKFNCNYKVVSCELDKESIKDVTVYYSTTPDVNVNIDDADTYQWKNNGWEEATLDSAGKINFGEGVRPTAWAVYGKLGFGQSIRVKLSIQLQSGDIADQKYETNKIVNLVKSTTETGDTKVTTETLRRTLEGLAWLDSNHNGQQDEGEKLLSGLKVKLLKLKEEETDADDIGSYEPAKYNGTGDSIEIETGKQVSYRANNNKAEPYDPDWGKETKKDGETKNNKDINGCYRFMDLPPGTYAVQFVDKDGNEIKYKATKVNVGDDDTIDSDGKPILDTSNEKKLSSTVICGIKMPEVEEIVKNGGSAIYRSEHNDSGFYPNSGLDILKTGEDSSPLAGAIFTIKEVVGGSSKAVSFTKNKENGSYTMSDPEIGGQPESPENEPEKFLIALANDKSKVMGINGENIALEGKKDDTTQKFEIDSSQLFEIYDVGDGYSAVKSVASNKWMSLNGDFSNGTPAIQMMDIDENGADDKKLPTDHKMHWTFQKWQNGKYEIFPRNAYKGNGVVIGESGTIELSNGTDGRSPEEFLIIPAARYNETTELEVGSDGKLIIENLKSNTSYEIEEIKSPIGYRILSQPGKIQVDEDGKITLTDDSGRNISVDNNKDTVLKLNIRNDKLYELPSAGGIGIYWYSIGGMLLMIAAALILYKNKCKEVLGS